MLWLAILGLVAVFLVVVVYLLYFFLVYRNKTGIKDYKNMILSFQESDSSLPKVSVIVSTFNESKVIGRKLENISELDYPSEKIEVLVLDDNSTDGTAKIAEEQMRAKKLFGKVLRNPTRIGLNKSLNLAVAKASNPLVCITDSDVTLADDALKKSVRILQGLEKVGGVTGKIEPVFEGKGLAQTAESSYRDFYHQSMLGESSLHSAFPGNGPLIIFNKTLTPSSIPAYYGSTDGNISMNIIKSGLRFIYVPNAKVYEPVPETVSQQRLQKIRRAKRLIQVFLHNTSVLFNRKFGSFGTTVFPLKFAMIVLCPTLLFVGTSFIVVSAVFTQNIVLVGLLVGAFLVFLASHFLVKGVGALLSSFLLHQFYLIAGLFSSFRRSVFWKTIERK
ncbi:glycosyltransferase [Candidatus Bathyarchaeota archaeon]|nr:glycosyltransferase [Candidatus Bathyarchaeota archaeon]